MPLRNLLITRMVLLFLILRKFLFSYRKTDFMYPFLIILQTWGFEHEI